MIDLMILFSIMPGKIAIILHLAKMLAEINVRLAEHLQSLRFLGELQVLKGSGNSADYN